MRAAGCVFAEEEAALLLAEAHDADHVQLMLRDRISGRPLEHVLGWAEFRHLRISVDDGVFVPRRRTGLLVDAALARVRSGGAVVELCCGAAAVGTALLTESPEAIELWASDIDPAAIVSARRNLEPLGGRVVLGDLFDGLPDSLQHGVDIVVANAPYVPTASIELMPFEARAHEPAVALDGGTDGLDVQRRIVSAAGRWLAPQGALVIETSERQATATMDLMRAGGLSPTLLRDEELDGTAVLGIAG
ncbi:MAG TPA: putative protein N(5)-glutamine methyltransferase [Plantibacter sp.]|uniref:putative protein N(5)-glutamine methyltransferase n=1 Tax=unclassified Plantibacter TaxID=2624265 RepID=UPI002C1AE0E9|nr:putative protein N(5)-glutamine methyltransferase [Plantibacter sp.]